MKKLTEIIQEAVAVHGNMYNYSLFTIFKDNKTKFKIICEKHGVFEQSVEKHIGRKQGCPKCAGRNKTNQEIIDECNLVHNFKYNYSKTEFKRVIDEVTIICPEHGEFRQVIRTHRKGSGCPKCSGVYKKNQLEFIEDCNKKHNNKYGYSQVMFINNKSMLDIECFKHGFFRQRAANHLRGDGCPKCANERVGLSNKSDTQTFINNSRLIFGNFYDYSKTIYVTAIKKVTITCPIHGDFEQTPNSHLSGHGCKKCSSEKNGKIATTSNEIFILNSQKIHNGFYSYPNCNYLGAKYKLKIECPIHGEFEQTGTKHLSGQGCPKCKGGIKLTQEEIIKRGIEIHGDKYGYDKVKYVNINTKINILCKKHNEYFLQSPNNHLRGDGCPKCGLEKMVNQKRLKDIEVLNKIKEIHGDRYEYPDFIYKNNSTKFRIVCSFHGEFFKSYDKHINRKQGCPKCVEEKKFKPLKKSGDVNILLSRYTPLHEKQTFFISKCEKVHNNKYSYPNTVFTNSKSKIKIECPIHGEFIQLARLHLSGSECPLCNKEKKRYNQLTNEEYINKCILKHGNRYDYSKTNYTRTLDNVIIICKEHGEFVQRASHHLSGSGCPNCNNQTLEPKLFNKLKETFHNEVLINWGKETWLGRQHFDIYFPEYKIAIEYQGGQHFKPNSIHGIKGYEVSVRNDNLKRQKCLDNNCILLYFTYIKKDVPDDYPYRVYITEHELITSIKRLIKIKKLQK